MFYPVLSTGLNGPKTSTGENDTVVSVYAMAFYWGHLLRGELLESEGHVVVFDNPCDANPFSYQIIGSDAVYLGTGDHHDPNYDDYLFDFNIFEVESFKEFEESYIGTPFNKEYCPYTIRVYPSVIVEETFRTNKPMLYACVASLVVATLSAIFLVYEHFVQRRIWKTQKSADTTKAIVNSLFPSAFHDRIMKANDEIADPEGTGKNRLQKFLSGEEDNKDDIDRNNSDLQIYKSPPIAELYLETTIMVRTQKLNHYAYSTQQLTLCHSHSLLTLQDSQLGHLQDNLPRFSCYWRPFTKPLMILQ